MSPGAIVSSLLQNGQSAERMRMGYCKQIVGSYLVFFKCSLMGSADVVRILNQ
jgi:hypothetical protein